MTPIDTLNPAQPWYLRTTPLATLPWLIRLRAVTAALDVVVLVVALVLPHLDFPLRQIAGLILDVVLLKWLLDLRA